MTKNIYKFTGTVNKEMKWETPKTENNATISSQEIFSFNSPKNNLIFTTEK